MYITKTKSLFTLLKSVWDSNLFKFLVANALYSLSTALISIMSPLLYDYSVYESYIYIFQMVLFITSISTAGLVPALLRYHKINNVKYVHYYILTSLVLFGVIFIVGLFPNNFLFKLLNLRTVDVLESLVISMSVICSLIFIFNRGLQTARESYSSIFNSVMLIFVLRILCVVLTSVLQVKSVFIILVLTCILPFLYEVFVYVKEVFRLNKCDYDEFYDFLSFIFKISTAGVIFLLTSRLFVISSKGYDDSLAASLSFATSFTGIISILNTTFTSYFIGKLDHRDINSIDNYLNRLKKYSLLFIIVSILLSSLVAFFVSAIYPENAIITAYITFITIFQSALITYIGMVTLLAKTFNLVHLQILMNVFCYILVFIYILFIDKYSVSECVSYTIVNSIIVLVELLLAFWILNRIKQLRFE